MENCIFCKIALGEIPGRTIEETEDFRVVLDVSPASRGHALILPKAHYSNLYELPEELAAEAMKLAKKVSIRMKERLNCAGVNLVQNNEAAAGQTVFHFHMHVIPRYEEDGQRIGWNPVQLPEQELDGVQKILL